MANGLLAEVVIGVPAPYLGYVRELLNPDFAVAAQNCLDQESGAFTGEICPVRPAASAAAAPTLRGYRWRATAATTAAAAMLTGLR